MTIFSANTGSFERVTVNDTTNTTSYLDGAVTVAGGMSIQKDLRISGSMTINGLLTVVSMSSQYVTSSQYNVGVSKITVNDDDNVRFAGFSVFDSGSSSPTTASIYWDSLNHKFLYENLSGSSYNSAILIAGPKNTGSLGNETGLTSGYIPYATGDDHIDNSVMFQSSSNIGIGTSTPGYKLDVYTVGGSSATTRLYGNDQTNVRLRLENIGSGGRTWELIGGLPGANNSNLSIYDVTGTSTRLTIDSSGNIGVSTTNPISKFTVVENGFGIRMQQSGSGDYLLISNNQIQSYVAAGTANILYLNYTSGGNIITGTGNVGIGTTNPASVLHLQSGTVNREMLVLRNTNTTSGASVPIFLSSDSGGSTTNVSIENGSAGDMVFRTGATSVAGYGNARMIILSGGNIGIGTASAPSKLTITDGVAPYAAATGEMLQIKRNTTNGTDAAQTRITLANNSNGFSLAYGGTSDRLRFLDGGAVEVMSMVNGGNVGIGTTNPTSLWSGDAKVLHVSASGTTAAGVRVASSRANVEFYSSGTTDNWGFYTAANMPFSLYTNNVERIRVTGDGNVGIGTTNPGTKMEIYRSTSDRNVITRLLTLNNYSTANPYDGYGTGILFKGTDYSNAVQSFAAIDAVMEITGLSTPQPDTAFGAGLRFYTGTNGTLTEQVRINTSGSVGIGRTNPSYKLDVLSSSSDMMRLYYNDGTYNPRLQISGTSEGIRIFQTYSSGADSLIFGTANFEQMRIKGSSVGIGTTNPSRKLHIYSTDDTRGLLIQNTSAASYAEAHFIANREYRIGTGGASSAGEAANNFYVYDLTAATQRFVINSSGNVGIGTTNPSVKLDVNGRTRSSDFGMTNSTGNYYHFDSFGGNNFMGLEASNQLGLYVAGVRQFRINGTTSVQVSYDGTNENGYFYVGKDWSATNHRINRQVTQGGVVLVVSAYGASGVNSDTAIFYSVNNYDANGAASALILGRNSSTSRSINAGGTINASGADYAEYMTKNGDFTLHKGDICGVDVNGELTNKYSEAHSFVVKSTDPSYVGGDTWGNDNAIGEKPYLTRQGDEETDEAYAERVAQYEIDMELYNTALEDARKLVDRIAFSGQVPVNVVGASVGDYILPTEGINDTIVGIAVTSPTFEQYQMAVGKVWKILEDGRAFISVKIG